MNATGPDKRPSIVVASGQAWKGFLGLALLVVSCALFYWVVYDGRNMAAETSFGIMLLGGLTGLTGIVFPLAAIRCPHCGDRWFWRAANRQQPRGWLKWLADQPHCPACERTIDP